MNSLKKLNDRIRQELHLTEEEYIEDEVMDDEDEFEDFDEIADEEEEQSRKDSRARIRVETESKIRGLIKNLEFEVNFRDLADRINDVIDGVVLTREKAHQLFNIIREFLDF